VTQLKPEINSQSFPVRPIQSAILDIESRN
jgi:hypothetical protein